MFSLSTPFPPIDTVTMNDAAKNAIFSGFITLQLSSDTLTYTLAKSGSNLYVTFSEDPLQRSSNDKIQITNLTSTSMTWIGIDPQVIKSAGVSIQAAYKIVFKK
jgi:hypothetical protein